jgi:hypothetical protein
MKNLGNVSYITRCMLKIKSGTSSELKRSFRMRGKQGVALVCIITILSEMHSRRNA